MIVIALECICAAIVLSYVAFRLVRASDATERRAFLVRFGVLAAGALLGEDSVIRAYRYYGYAPSWSLKLDLVPVIVVLVWPVVIDSAAAIARSLVRGPLRVASLAAAIVLLDASLIEPIAVRAGLWSWTHPGIFDVPLIGITGWAMFTWAAVLAIETDRAKLVPLLAPLATHVLLLASYWLLFKWIAGSVSDEVAVIGALAVLVVVTLLALRHGRRIPVMDILARAPGALFFFVLLATLPSTGRLPLVLYALAFAPPYLVALARRDRSHEIVARAL